jgi:S1-C subfamily serine protease
MWLRKADLLGLAIGFTLGGTVLVGFLPHIQGAFRPAPPVRHVQLRPMDADDPPPIVVQRYVPQVVIRPPPPDQVAALPPLTPPKPAPPAADFPAPAELPRIVAPEPPRDGAGIPPLPNVIGPSQPRKGSGMAGTGFFIADDGSLLTAAHVVNECRRTEILSRLVKLTPAEILARDPKQDIALLRARHVRPPALLPLGRPGSSRMVVFGYPASAGPTIPEETAATLQNSKFPKPFNALTDPRDVVWIAADAVTHGYSGGPILDPDRGVVVGIVKGMIDTGRFGVVLGMPKSGVSIGPGAGTLGAFLKTNAPDLELGEPLDTGDAVLDDARRAIVHVICQY